MNIFEQIRHSDIVEFDGYYSSISFYESEDEIVELYVDVYNPEARYLNEIVLSNYDLGQAVQCGSNEFLVLNGVKIKFFILTPTSSLAEFFD